MKQRFVVGDIVRLASDAKENECYAKFRDDDLRITSVSTRYMPAKEFFAQGKPEGYHPGFDASAGCALYDVERMDGGDIPVSLYDWELKYA